MNIPQDTLQAVADAAFAKPIQPRLTTRPYHLHDWALESDARRAVIQYALDNPALAPWLNVSQAWPQVVEYTDSDIHCAWRKAVESDAKFVDRIRAFLAALPRRENPDLAQAIARAEKAEAKVAELQAWKDSAMEVEREWDAQAIAKSLGAIPGQSCRRVIAKRVPELLAELAALKSAQLGIIRPIAEMPETVPEGCVVVTGWKTTGGRWALGRAKSAFDAHFAILRLPATEARQERPVGFNSALETWGAAEATPPAEPEPAAQVPLRPDDVPPGSVFRSKDQPDTCFWTVSQVWERGFYLRGECVDWHLAMARMEINTSLATGRWDATAWRPCSKPAGKEVAK